MPCAPSAARPRICAEDSAVVARLDELDAKFQEAEEAHRVGRAAELRRQIEMERLQALSSEGRSTGSVRRIRRGEASASAKRRGARDLWQKAQRGLTTVRAMRSSATGGGNKSKKPKRERRTLTNDAKERKTTGTRKAS